jgi:DNA polymerase-3 subunit gamma/tau
MRQHLEHICADEGVTVEPAVLPLVVRAGAGSARDSLSVLDQLIAGAGPSGVTYADAVGLLGVTDTTLLNDMVDALAAGDAASVYGTVDGVVEAGHDPRRFAADLLDRFRDLIVIDAVPGAAASGLIDETADELSRMTEQAARLGAATLARNAEIVHTALIEMRGTTSPRLVLELLCARMLLPDAAADSAALLQRLERLERRNAALSPPEAQQQAPAEPAPKPKAKAKAKPKPEPKQEPTQEPTAAAAPPAESGAMDAAAVRRLWPDVLDVVKQTSKRTRALLDNAQVAGVAGERLTLAAPTAALAKMISEDGTIELVRTALASIVGGNWQVVVETNGGNPARALPSDEPDPRDDPHPPQASASDPEADALHLLQSTLGARPLERDG